MKKILYIAFILMILSSCGDKKQNVDEDKIQASTAENTPVVQWQVLKKQTWYDEIITQGTLRARQKADLRFKRSGKLQNIFVKNGQKVGKNQLLALLDTTEEWHNLQTAKVEWQKAQNQYYIKMLEIAPHSDTAALSPQKKHTAALVSGYISAQTALRRAKYSFSLNKLFAPFAGKIANLNIQNYNYINPADIFCTLIDDSQFFLDFNILASERNKVKKGTKISFHPLTQTQTTFSGQITEINPTIDKNGMIAIRALVPGNNALIDGMQMQISVRREKQKQIVVPKTAVVNRSGKAVAFTYSQGLAKWKYIDIAGENANSFLITNGLKQGDTLITNNNFNLVHDAEVRLFSTK